VSVGTWKPLRMIPCARGSCAVAFWPTGPRSRYCARCRGKAHRRRAEVAAAVKADDQVEDLEALERPPWLIERMRGMPVEDLEARAENPMLPWTARLALEELGRRYLTGARSRPS
jgi:hypothetical protein